MITSWNALMISGLCDAYQTFGDSSYLNEALQCMKNIKQNAYNSAGHLLHVESHKGKLHTGYLEDYAFTTSALISLYKVTFDESWLYSAQRLTEAAIEHFMMNRMECSGLLLILIIHLSPEQKKFPTM